MWKDKMHDDCREEPPSELLEGIGQFNRGEYYECHETLEEIWREEQGEIRNLYKGILQVGVAIFHAKRSNLSGAMRLVASGMDLLRPFAPECMRVDVAHLLQSAELFRENLERLASDPDTVLSAIPVIRLVK
jgi:predicted metal-dependent hydrolase